MRKTRLVSLALSLATALGVSLTLAAPAQAAPADRYVALGDSYASGVGAGSYTSESGSCQRSTNAYPALYAAAVKPASYRSVACSGATTTSLINTQLSALSSTTTLVSVTVGGNDVGFSSILSTCVLQGTTQCVAAVQAAQDKARAQLPGLLRNVYNGIKTRSPNARVVVVGYPVFYQLGTVCVGLSATSRAKINEGINLIDNLTRTAAVSAGFTFADVRSSFVGHQLCSYGEKWMHALNFATLGVSYHPTAAGQVGGYLPVFRAAAD
ncbi:SGNH/GDSL hydrolase family protein [Micromonospora peucetia]|uniref:GDSL-like Lipase/Acylhydrolase family protein n=1 Tax=Micromonospora peucetia TaxID=47871 RepID=A0A1C6VWL9_9ACTN|nr:SGNH/GDSL hydrolase family protein [Micromonospora peucetia]MCX4387877.1 SGNH/GDSL hydrolase family protein [Micromonospora peucetia]WSA31415.1 SGNH/GDSL hydrolase family protein [Micromonospora peucetia]SCL70759.1 GDSL-like Lipase/Acylhydrolase family protein [Micromonospora peucetia]